MKTMQEQMVETEARLRKEHARRHEALRMHRAGKTYEDIGKVLGGVTRQRIQQMVALAKREAEEGA